MNDSARQSPTIELSMIVKNGGRTLSRCLQSVQGAVDRILIGDTGSIDDSVALARSFQAEVFSLSWTGDFSAARNTVLRQATSDWILVLDADEMLDPEGVRVLRKLTAFSGPDAYDVVRWNYVRTTNSRAGEHGALPNPVVLAETASYPAYVKSTNTRLFRRHPGIYFERPVHETVVHRIEKLGMRVAPAPFVIHHFGHAEDEEPLRAAKNAMYREIGCKHLAACPEDARTCVELGLGELEHSKNPEAALALFTRALRIESTNTEAMTLVGVCLVRLHRYGEAIEFLTRATTQGASGIVLYEALGDGYFHRQQYTAAFASYRTAQTQGSASALLLAKKSVCEIYEGQTGNGLQGLRGAYALEPTSTEVVDIVVAGAALGGDTCFAAQLATERLAMDNPTPLHTSIADTLHRLNHAANAFCQPNERPDRSEDPGSVRCILD